MGEVLQEIRTLALRYPGDEESVQSVRPCLLCEHEENGEEMKKVLAWLSSWGTTLRIMLFERETYRVLRQEDFTEVSPDLSTWLVKKERKTDGTEDLDRH